MASSPIVAGYCPPSIFDCVPPGNIKFSVFTHLFYASLQVDPSTYKLIVTDHDKSMLSTFSAAAHGHSVKALLSICGDPSVFAKLVANSAYRKTFIQSTIDVAHEFDLDGLDLDWEFPNTTEGMKNLNHLFIEWRRALQADPKLLLTAVVSFKPSEYLSHSHPVIANMATALDWINVMAYDLPGSKNPYATRLHAALYDPTGAGVSVTDGVAAWMTAGMPAKKIVLGMPLYARIWQLTDPNQHGVGAPAKTFGPGPVPPGVLSYSEVVKFKGTVVDDEQWGEAYSYAIKAAWLGYDNPWLGYDDEWTVWKKVEYARSVGIAGSFCWAIDQDDTNWTLTTAVWNAWHQ